MADSNLTRKQKFILAMTAIILIGQIEVVALLMGIDGQVMTVAVGAIAAAGGLAFGKRGTQSS